MNKLRNKISFALIAFMTTTSVFADSVIKDCGLVERLHQVFKLLQMFAFIGAAFFIAGWAWDFISGGKAEVKTIKEKGTGLLVGFILLFAVGVLLSFVSNVVGNKLGLDCDLPNW